MEEISIGELEAHLHRFPAVSEWISISQALVNSFAELTGDRQFIHIDPERAWREGPFGGTVAHGLLTLSLFPAMAKEALPPLKNVRSSVNYGFDYVRFVAPVKVGQRVRARFAVRSIEPRGADAVLIDWQITVEIDGAERPALVANWLGLRNLEKIAA